LDEADGEEGTGDSGEESSVTAAETADEVMNEAEESVAVAGREEGTVVESESGAVEMSTERGVRRAESMEVETPHETQIWTDTKSEAEAERETDTEAVRVTKAEAGAEVKTVTEIATARESEGENEQRWLLATLSHATNKEEKEALAAYCPTVREYALFYSAARVPIAPLHYAVHALHITAGMEVIEVNGSEADHRGRAGLYSDAQPPPRTWFFYAKQAIDHASGNPGVSVVAMWEQEQSLPRDQEYLRRRHWEQSIYRKVAAGNSALAETVTFLQTETSEDGSMAGLLAAYKGWFFVSDGPTGGVQLTNERDAADAQAAIRFYTAEERHAMSEATAERPSSHLLVPLFLPKSNDAATWATFRMDIGTERETHLSPRPLQEMRMGSRRRERLTLGGGSGESDAGDTSAMAVGKRERYVKYAVMGNATFWSFIASAGVDALNLLRSAVEERLFQRPVGDIVSEAWTGPLTFTQLTEELSAAAAEKDNQFRLTSAVEEWSQLLSSKLSSFLSRSVTSRPPVSAVSTSDMAVAVLVNISLEDPSNWAYWEEELHLHEPANWAKLTCRSSVPPRYRRHVNDMGALASSFSAATTTAERTAASLGDDDAMKD